MQKLFVQTKHGEQKETLTCMSTTKENRNYCLVTMRSWIKSWKHALTEMQKKIENQSNLTLPHTLCK
jgi:hypothetical protein